MPVAITVKLSIQDVYGLRIYASPAETLSALPNEFSDSFGMAALGKCVV